LARLSTAEDALGKAKDYLHLARESAGPDPSDVFLGLAERCQAHLDGHRGEWDSAVRHLEESARLLGGSDLPAEVGKAQLALGEAYANRGMEGDGERACEHLLTARSVFKQIQAQGYLARVSALLRELGRELEALGGSLEGDRSPVGTTVARQQGGQAAWRNLPGAK
jgi:hypothetical protein